jgi:hypothetical protein
LIDTMSRRVARGLAALGFSVLLLGVALGAPPKRDWIIPRTHPGTVELLPATDDWSVSIRRVGMRSREGKLDALGDLTVYPAVMSPKGVVYLGFERHYPAGSVGRRWLFWDFPTQFRAPGARVKTEELADFGDHLLDTVILDTAPEKKVIPSGIYQVKWVVNDQLIDNGDTFRYSFHKSEADRP